MDSGNGPSTMETPNPRPRAAARGLTGAIPVHLPLFLALLFAADAAPRADKYFLITVVDEQTGRGVPLVELRTTNNLRYYTDSNGVVAFHEPGLMDQTVFFHVQSHGYEFPKDGFGFRGEALRVTEGGSAKLAIKRLNIAERLYRVTGAGIYADSVLVGEKPPIRQPLLNAQVMGSDSVVNAVYRGKLYWFWGDTNRPAYPLGNFDVPGATSALPNDGSLDPEVGVDLSYFVDKEGFAKPVARMPGEGPTWIGGATVLRDPARGERLFACYVKIKPPMETYERGLVEWDDEKNEFLKLVAFDLKSPLYPVGHSFHRTEDGIEYVYFCHPFPLIRVRADADSLRDPARYEAYTPLKQGSRLNAPEIERVDGKVRFAWKRNTPPLSMEEQSKLVRAGKLKAEESLLHFQDGETGKAILTSSGSVCWNDYRKRWVAIVQQAWGTSFLGEIWYAEADTPLGPWVYARKIVTHDKYTFYNVKQHPYFDKDDGRVIFFEGTYTTFLSGAPGPTPRYDYNQIMYKLDLADPRLALPVAIYQTSKDRPGRFSVNAPGNPIGFFALDRSIKGTVAVYSSNGKLTFAKPSNDREAKPLFHALLADLEKPPATTTPLYEFVHQDAKRRAYTTDANWSAPGYERTAKPICLVWRNPLRKTLPGNR
jgi:hypothetical protein